MGGVHHPTFNPYDHLNDTPRQLMRHGWFRSMTLAALLTLSMGCMGSAILPTAGAFASTGIVVGFLAAILVAAANVYTSNLLLRQARATGGYDFESVAHLVAGPWWQLFVEVANWVILFGGIMGGIVQLGEAGTAALQMVWCESETKGLWLLGPAKADGTYAGNVLMVFYVLILILPFAFVRSMAELEFAGGVGYLIVLWLVFSVIAECIKRGFPAIKDGSLPTVGFTSLGAVGAAFSTMMFSFYIQPIMMPYYSELPIGNAGSHAISIATTATLLGTALIPYVAIGFFGAALWGPAAADTGNVLLNDVHGTFGPDGKPTCPSRLHGALNICVTVYLAIALPVMEAALRHIVNTWVSQIRKRFNLKRFIPKRDKGWGGYARNVCVSMLNLATCLGLALACAGGGSAMVLTITGATGVLAVSFIIPIVNHFVMLSGRARVQKEWLATEGGTQLLRGTKTVRDNKDSAAEETAANLSFFAVGDDADTVPAAAAWGSLSASRTGSRALASGSLSAGAGGRQASLSSPQPASSLVRDLEEVGQVNPESFSDDAPLTNMFQAYKLADPMAYRSHKTGAAFWLLDVAVPVVVLAFGIFCSVCTLMGVGQA